MIFDKDKDGQVKLKQEAFAAKTVFLNGERKDLYKRIHGKKFENVPTGIITDLDFTIPYANAKVEAIEIINGKLGDNVTFEVHHPQAGLLNTFGTTVFMDASGYYEQRSQYDADVVQGLIFKLKFDNQNEVRDIYINYILNEVK